MPRDESATGSSLGDLITKYRLRQRHQDDRGHSETWRLPARLTSAYQPHENNLYHPQYATLVRICDALALSQTERAYLLPVLGIRWCARYAA
jgi:hypothetical protein